MIALVIIATTILHGQFLRRQKLALIDQQARQTAAVLLGSGLNGLQNLTFDRVESIISEELGENRVGKVFVIRNNAGTVLFESPGAKELRIAEIAQFPHWITVHRKGRIVRLLNLSLPRVPDRTLQVALVLDEDFLSAQYFARENLFFTSLIMAIALLVAWVLASLLMKPVSRLSAFVARAGRDSAAGRTLPELPKDLRRFSAARDEFADLLRGFETLIRRVNHDHKMSRLWSYQMAHELKTPMALIEALVAEDRTRSEISSTTANAILKEVFGVSETITSFLTWAETENAAPNKRLFVSHASKLVSDVQTRLEAGFRGRTQIHVVQDFQILTNLQHFDQALTNLVVNALVYSKEPDPVILEINAPSIRVIDQGPGVPSGVLERLGEPFNRGERTPPVSERKANGLGLALVHSLCRLYRWQLQFHHHGAGTAVEIRFPPIEPELEGPIV